MEDPRGNFTQTEIDWLRSELPDFGSEESSSDSTSAELKQYLTFYQLPKASNDVQLIVGKSPDRQTLIAAWKPTVSRGTVVVVHGYMDHIGLYNHLIKYLLQQQLNVVCFDLMGHGLSSGDPGSINNFSQYVEQLEQVIALSNEYFPGPTHGIGQSMGGAILPKHRINKPDNNQNRLTSLVLKTHLGAKKIKGNS